MARSDQELDFTISRLINNQGAAEGPIVPPRLQGGIRVPSVSGLRVAKVEQIPLGGTQVTLTWTNPYKNTFVSGYNIMVFGLLAGNQPQGPYFTEGSPGVVVLQVAATTRLTFVVQTVLYSGQTSPLEQSPSVATTVEVTQVTPSDIPDGSITLPKLAPGTPGELITWDSTGLPDTISTGSTNNLLAGNGVGAKASFKSLTTLDIVEGRANITTPDLITVVDSAGVIKESSVDINDIVTTTNDYVEGAAALTTSGAVPWVTAAGELTSDATLFKFNVGSKYLGVNVASPSATLHAKANSVLQEVQKLETTVGSGTTPNETVYQTKVTTTNATPTGLFAIGVPTDTTLALDAVVIARRTGGSAGTAQDGARYHIQGVYKNVGGTATIIGALNVIADEDQPAWDATFVTTSNNVLVEVTGAVNNNITWIVTARYYTVST